MVKNYFFYFSSFREQHSFFFENRAAAARASRETRWVVACLTSGSKSARKNAKDTIARILKKPSLRPIEDLKIKELDKIVSNHS